VSGNTVSLSAILAAIDPLRHTPAGLPVVDFTLAHASQQDEAGSQRQVEFDMPAKATGDLATRIAIMRQGCQASHEQASGPACHEHGNIESFINNDKNMPLPRLSCFLKKSIS